MATGHDCNVSVFYPAKVIAHQSLKRARRQAGMRARVPRSSSMSAPSSGPVSSVSSSAMLVRIVRRVLDK